MLGLLELGIIGVILLIAIFIIILPVILTIIVGIGFANLLGFSGIFWWAFVILFYIIIGTILGIIGV